MARSAIMALRGRTPSGHEISSGTSAPGRVRCRRGRPLAVLVTALAGRTAAPLDAIAWFTAVLRHGVGASLMGDGRVGLTAPTALVAPAALVARVAFVALVTMPAAGDAQPKPSVAPRPEADPETNHQAGTRTDTGTRTLTRSVDGG